MVRILTENIKKSMNKNIFSIPAGLSFADILAGWVLERYGADALSLPRVLLLLPSRRACLSLREAFLRVTGGRPTLLPRMQPLGDVDTDILLSGLPADEGLLAPTPAGEHKRLFILARLIRAHHHAHGRSERMDHALRQAADVAELLDELEREGGSLSALAGLVPDEFAHHWQQTTEFLNIVAEHWPAIAEDKKLVGIEAWRNRALRSLAALWERLPPDHPVIAAGSTGSIAATGNLLRVIAGLPQGAVVLPGVDMQASDTYYEHITESHPQWGLKSLLGELGMARGEVQAIGTPQHTMPARTALISRALCPAECFSDWHNVPQDAARAVEGLAFATHADQQEEASSIALMLRETLEEEGKTAALVTHDRKLARRVVAQMQRYGVQVDDSAGKALAVTPAATLMRLLLEVAQSNAAPVKLLALLGHPLARVGMERIACLEAARALENELLRGVCPCDGIKGLRGAAQMKNASREVKALLASLEEVLAPLQQRFASGGMCDLKPLLEAHIETATGIAGAQLWQGNDASALAELFEELREAGEEAGEIEISAYPSLFDVLLAGKAVRPEFGVHPRLRILSPIEARMQSFDRIILGGMNEGSWPQEPASDPWFNRAMRKAVGLPVPEVRIGQSAHDFTQLAAAAEVIITRAQKVDGTPTSPSRWWMKLETLIGHYGLLGDVESSAYATWANMQDKTDEVVPCARPLPVPPLDARPKEIAITQVEKWLRDAYAFYARSVLRLKKLDEVDQDPAAADFGNDVHKVLETFAKRHPNALPENPLRELLSIGHDVFARYEHYYPVVQAWWWPRFEQVAEWLLQQEATIRPHTQRIWAEVDGRMEVEGVTFTGRADRLEQGRGGELAIVDYKTGSAHSKKDTAEGNAVQLMLLALLAQQGKWNADIPQGLLSRLEYWIIGGGRNNGEVRTAENYDASHIAEVKEKLAALVRAYRQPEKGYAANATSDGSRFNDYEHLTRAKEWR